MRRVFPDVAVISYDEIAKGAEVQNAGVISLAGDEPMQTVGVGADTPSNLPEASIGG